MNQNFMKSSFKAVAAALVASLAFTSCSKDQFTEKDALNLELQRLRAQRSIDSIKTAQDRTDRNSLLRYQRTLDSLDRENAGGRVFYTVNVISATSSAVAGGRTEESEGVTGAVVTTSQYGRVVSATTQSGIATFELRSGEATVAVTAPAHTSADYTVNLTAPFSGGQTGNSGSAAAQTAGVVSAAKNGTTVYVSNVLPLFQASTDGAVMATIRGRVFIETDLTNDREEIVGTTATALGNQPSRAAIEAAGLPTGAPIFVSAGINSNNPAFFSRYLAKTGAFSTSGANLGGSAMAAGLGTITKLFYGAASAPAGTGINTGSGATTATVNRVPVSASGDYTILVPATVSGLPIVIKSDEIVANRTYFRSGGIQTTERFLYGPNVEASPVPTNAGTPRVSFQAFTTPASVTVSYVAESVRSSFSTGSQTLTPTPGGFYGVAPTVSFAAVGTPAGTGLTANAVTAAVAAGTTGTASGLFQVTGVNITAGGVGFANVAGNDATFSFTRTDLITIGAGRRLSTGAGSVPLNVQVTNGGLGFNYLTPGSFVAGAANGAQLGFGPATPITAMASPTVGLGAFTGFLPTPSIFVPLGQTAPTFTSIPDLTIGNISAVQVTGSSTGLLSTSGVFNAITAPPTSGSGFVFGPDTRDVLPSTGVVVAGPSTAVRDLIVSSGTAGVPQLNALLYGATPTAVAPLITATNYSSCTTCASITHAQMAAYQLPNATVSTVATAGDIVITSSSLTARTSVGARALTGGGGYTFGPNAFLGAVSATGAQSALTGSTPATFQIVAGNTSATLPDNAAAQQAVGGQLVTITMSGGQYGTIFSGMPNSVAVPPTGVTSIRIGFVASTLPGSASTLANNPLSANFGPGGTGIGVDNFVVTNQPFSGPTGIGAGQTSTAITSLIGTAPATGIVRSYLETTAPNIEVTPAVASNLLAGSPWLVYFPVPTGGTQAWGVPVFSGNVITGVRVVRGGSGYPPTADQAMSLMPNPFRGNLGANMTTAATFTTTAAPVAGAVNPLTGTNPFFTGNFDVTLGRNIVDALSNAVGTSGLPLTLDRGYLLFTVDAANQGSGYAQTPTIALADGGLTFGQIATNLGSAVSTALNGVVPVVMSSDATRRGFLQRVGNIGVPRAGVTALTETGNQGFFLLPEVTATTPAFVTGAPIAAIVIDELSNSLTNAYNAGVVAGLDAAMTTPATTASRALVANNPAITIGDEGANRGTILGLGSLPPAGVSLTDPTAAVKREMTRLPEDFVRSASWPAVGFHAPPSVTISAPGVGTNVATAIIDPAGAELITGNIPGIRANTTNTSTGNTRTDITTYTVPAVNGASFSVTVADPNARIELVSGSVADNPVASVSSTSRSLTYVFNGTTNAVVRVTNTNSATPIAIPAAATVAYVNPLPSSSLGVAPVTSFTSRFSFPLTGSFAGAISYEIPIPAGTTASLGTVVTSPATGVLTAMNPVVVTPVGNTLFVTVNTSTLATAREIFVTVNFTGATPTATTTLVTNPTMSATNTAFSAGATAATNATAPVVTIVNAGSNIGAAITAPTITSTFSTSTVPASTLVLGGKIQAIRVTAGGAGYGRGNLFQRNFASQAGGQDYTIIGSQVSNTSAPAAGMSNNNGPQLGVIGSQFDVMTGVTYVRDIHYGTGRLVD